MEGVTGAGGIHRINAKRRQAAAVILVFPDETRFAKGNDKFQVTMLSVGGELLEPTEIDKLAMRMGFGVRDGNGVIFVSHKGEVYPAGFLPHPMLGNVRDEPLSSIYRNSPLLAELRDMDRLKGKCGRCEFRWMCGGSRARAYGMTGDVMESDPFCVWEPGD